MRLHGTLVVSLLSASLLLSIASTSVAYADDHSGPTSSPSIQPETSATTPSGFATGQASLAYDAGTGTGEVLSVIRHSDGTVTYAFATLAHRLDKSKHQYLPTAALGAVQHDGRLLVCRGPHRRRLAGHRVAEQVEPESLRRRVLHYQVLEQFPLRSST